MAPSLITEEGHVPFLEKYRDIFGKVGTGVHSYRFFGMAIVDVLMTILGFGILSYFLNIPLWQGILGGFILGIVAHRAFSVKTTIDKALFGKT